MVAVRTGDDVLSGRDDVVASRVLPDASSGAGLPVTSPVDAGAAPAVRRPTLGRFLWYCYGGSLPPENHTWVLHDVTCRTWVLRHFARWTMLIAPLLALYLAFMPAPFGTRFYTGITFGLAIYVMSLVFILIDTDRRAVRAGYGPAEPQAVRTAKVIERQRSANYQRRQRIAERRARNQR
jgi:hypothetical protein